MGKHFWESDREYAGRVNQEANEKVIEESTGSAPSKRFWEGDSDYRGRISREANELTIEKSTGNAPSQRFWESDDHYRGRISLAAHEAIISNSSGSSPSQRLWESDDAYRSRISREANELTIQNVTGTNPTKGFFESESKFRRRIYVQARELRASGVESNDGPSSSFNTSTQGQYRGYSSDALMNSKAVWGLTLVIVGLAALGIKHLGGVFGDIQSKGASTPSFPVAGPGFHCPSSLAQLGYISYYAPEPEIRNYRDVDDDGFIYVEMVPEKNGQYAYEIFPRRTWDDKKVLAEVDPGTGHYAVLRAGRRGAAICIWPGHPFIGVLPKGFLLEGFGGLSILPPEP